MKKVNDEVIQMTLGVTCIVALVVLIFTMWSGPVLAGPPSGGPNIERLTEKLDLSPEQVTQVEAIFADARERMEAVRDSGVRPNPEEARRYVRDQLETVLTPEQLDKFDSLNQQRKGNWRQRRNGGREKGDVL